MIDTAIVWTRVESARRQGRFEQALAELRRLIEVVERIDFEYEEWLRTMVECLVATDQNDQAIACQAYLGPVDVPPEDFLVRQKSRAETGDSRTLRGMRLHGIYLSRSTQHRAAAQWFGASAMPVHQAIELERARQDVEASQLWASLIERGAFEARSYELALAKINLGLCLFRQGHDGAVMALAQATAAIEEVADSYESEGLRERAFDCYQLLARIGVETDTFENVAEGYLNSVRILKDDSLRYDALRLYEAFVTLARRANEHHAVAGILREAAEYCTRSGLPYGDDLRWRCGDAWIVAAQSAQRDGLPGQIVENAYLAAAEAYVSVRAFKQAARTYQALSELEIKGRDRFVRLVARLGKRPEDPPHPIPVPEYLKRLPDYEEVWYVDLAEWELQGDPALIAGGVMADRRFPDFVRRHGLLLVLEILRRGEQTPVPEIVRRLKEIRAYPVIDALEHLYWRGDASVRREVCKVMGTLRFKRSFAILASAMMSEDSQIREDACQAISSLSFPHAFDRLRRIFESRELPDPVPVRSAALRAIGKINTFEALEFLCDRLRRGEAPYAEQASAAIAELSSSDLVVHLRQQIDFVPSAYRSVLDDAANRLSQRQRGGRR